MRWVTSSRARTALDDALATAREQDNWFLAARVQRRRGRLLADLGEPAASAVSLREAVELFLR